MDLFKLLRQNNSQLPEVPDDEVLLAIKKVPTHFGAGTLVDMGFAEAELTLGIGGNGSGLMYAQSGGVIGLSIDRLNAHQTSIVCIQGCAVFGSGQLRVQVQASDSDTSGNFTDPTSGLAALPSWCESGGIFRLNSGSVGGGTRAAFVSGHAIQSGFCEFGYFQTPGRYVRANLVSGDWYAGTLTVSIIGQPHTEGSGGGFTYSPGSGLISV